MVVVFILLLLIVLIVVRAAATASMGVERNAMQGIQCKVYNALLQTCNTQAPNTHNPKYTQPPIHTHTHTHSHPIHTHTQHTLFIANQVKRGRKQWAVQGHHIAIGQQRI